MLPQNVEVHKRKVPQKWCYPVKTSELVDLLKLGDLSKKVRIYYDNSPEKPYKLWKKDRGSFSFTVLSLTYYGHLPEDSPNTERPYFFMSVRLCRPSQRQKLLQAINELSPRICRWFDAIQRTKSINSISLRYEDFSERIQPRLVLSENKVEVCSIPIDLKDAPDEDKATVNPS